MGSLAAGRSPALYQAGEMGHEAQEMVQAVCGHAEENAGGGGQEDGGGRPFEAAGLPVDGEAGGGAGPVEEAENHQAQGGDGRPALGGQDAGEGGYFFQLGQGSRLEVGHEHDGQHDLVGGKAQEEGGQNDAVQAHEAAQGIQEAGEGG